MKFQVYIHRDEDGVYVASCPALKGCHSQGKTYEACLKNIQKAIEVTVEYLSKKKILNLDEVRHYPRLIATEEITVAA